MKDLKPTIRMVYEAHGKLPSVEWLVKTAKVTPEEATRAIGEYNVEEAPFQQAKEVSTEPPAISHNLPLTAIRWMAGTLAGVAIVRAMFYAFGWFGSTDDPVLSWLMSGLVVGVTVLMPQMAVVLYRNGSTWLSALAFVLAAIVMLFSMVMTVAGIYNDRSAKATESAQVKQDALRASGVWTDLLAREKLLTDTIDKAGREYSRIGRELDKLTPEDKLYDALQARLDRQGKKVESLRGELLNLQMEKAKTGAVVEPRQDFFDWLSSVLGIPRDVLEFSLAVVPALVIDVAYPVLLFVVFFVS